MVMRTNELIATTELRRLNPALPPLLSVTKEIPPMSPSPHSPDNQELANQIDAIRADIQSLTSTVGRMANKQINRAQDKAMETANQAEEAIRQNPLSAVAIAVGLGFLFGIFTRR